MIKKLILGFIVSSLMGFACAQSVEKYQAGVDYFVLNPAQATSVASNKVEVIEVFNYACRGCAIFQPYVDAWKKKMPAQAQFVYLPAAINGEFWDMMARTYYTAKALGVAEKTHNAVFDALHNSPTPVRDLDGLASLFAKYGIKPEVFKATMTSFAVNIAIDRSNAMMPRYKLEGTPEIYVAGKYRINGKSAKGNDKIFDVVNFLVAKEVAARGLNK